LCFQCDTLRRRADYFKADFWIGHTGSLSQAGALPNSQSPTPRVCASDGGRCASEQSESLIRARPTADFHATAFVPRGVVRSADQ
jgi:hypothetical protein